MSNDSATGGARQPTDPHHACKVLICDLVGLKFGADGKPDHSEVQAHIEAKGGVFHLGDIGADGIEPAAGRIHFFYRPDLSTEAELLAAAQSGRYDAVIAAATNIPNGALFRMGGVRIGAGTGNMGSASWGGGNGSGGEAPLMNTPGFNSLATAHMVIKAVLSISPDLPVDALHARVVAGDFDTGRQLRDFPTEKLEGKRFAVLGYGNIGRAVAKLAKAFGMEVSIHARAAHKDWIESEGFVHAATPLHAACGADFISAHVGLGRLDAATGRSANAGLVDAKILDAVRPGAVLINYDRGEVVDTIALDAALASGRIRAAFIDADLFKDEATGDLSGPLVPYLDLARRHAGRVRLLPHATADTDHPSRVAGAKQAVDQIFDAVLLRRVVNLKGDLPPRYASAGERSPPGVGKVSAADFARVAEDTEKLETLAGMSRQIADFWQAVQAAEGEARGRLIERDAERILRTLNRHTSLLDELALQGPFAK